jgi:[ribosomal protein S18]-alanine N-acetyltransferase
LTSEGSNTTYLVVFLPSEGRNGRVAGPGDWPELTLIGHYAEPPMRFHVRAMDEGSAAAIASWHYDGPYSFYDLTSDEDDLNEFMDRSRWGDVLFAVDDQTGELVGFYEFTRVRDGDVVEVGLGLRPDLTGRGLGGDFIDGALEFGRRRFRPRAFRLAVAAFNERAIQVYERAGFVRTGTHTRRLGGRDVAFVDMTRDA